MTKKILTKLVAIITVIFRNYEEDNNHIKRDKYRNQ